MVTARDILALAEPFAVATNVPLTTVSSRVFDDSKKLAAIDAGADLTLTRFARAVEWFAANWPDNAVWPVGVERPSPAPQPAEAS